MTADKPHITAEFLTLLPARHVRHHSWRQDREQMHVVRLQSRAMDVMTKTADYHKKYVAQRLVEGKDLPNCTLLIFSVIMEEEGKVRNVLLRQTLPNRITRCTN